MYQNRKARRDFARLAKMLKIKQKATRKQQFEMTLTAINAGRQIHAKFVEDNENRMVKARTVRNEATIAGLVDIGLTRADASKIVANNQKLVQDRKEKIWAKANKTK